MPVNSHLVLAFFEDEAAADGAVGALQSWAKHNRRVQLDAVGVLVKEADGQVKTHKLGPTEGRKGVGIGAVLGVVAGIASGRDQPRRNKRGAQAIGARDWRAGGR